MSGVGVSGKCQVAWDCAGVMGAVLWWNLRWYESRVCGGWKKGISGHACSVVEVEETWE